jgi:hypothetical protein
MGISQRKKNEKRYKTEIADVKCLMSLLACMLREIKLLMWHDYPSWIQAEAFALQLAAPVASVHEVQEPSFFAGCAILAKDVAANILSALEHWWIRPQLATIIASHTIGPKSLFHVLRSLKFTAHHYDRLATEITSINSYFFSKTNTPTRQPLLSESLYSTH